MLVHPLQHPGAWQELCSCSGVQRLLEAPVDSPIKDGCFHPVFPDGLVLHERCRFSQGFQLYLIFSFLPSFCQCALEGTLKPGALLEAVLGEQVGMRVLVQGVTRSQGHSKKFAFSGQDYRHKILGESKLTDTSPRLFFSVHRRRLIAPPAHFFITTGLTSAFLQVAELLPQREHLQRHQISSAHCSDSFSPQPGSVSLLLTSSPCFSLCSLRNVLH